MESWFGWKASFFSHGSGDQGIVVDGFEPGTHFRAMVSGTELAFSAKLFLASDLISQDTALWEGENQANRALSAVVNWPHCLVSLQKFSESNLW